eukprot:145081_1
MTSNNPPQNQQNPTVWGWTNSLNTFVENTKTASESFFDNVAATLNTKKEQANMHNNNNKLPPQPINKQQLQSEDQKKQEEPTDPYTKLELELSEWKSKHSQLKTAHSLKTAMLQNELQKYKDTNTSFNRHISLQTESKIAKLESQILSYKQNEIQLTNIIKENIQKYYQNTDYLQHQIDNKYKIFYEKLLNITIKAGLNPKDLNIKNEETMSVISDFDEKEQIHNAEEFTVKMNNKTDKQYEYQSKSHEKYEETIIEFENKLKTYECSLDEYRDKYLQTIETNNELNTVCKELNNKLTQQSTHIIDEKEEYKQLQTLFESMSDKNTDFQQQIKDVNTENELLRKQVNQYKSQHQSDINDLVLQNGVLKQQCKELQLTYDEINNKLNDEYGLSEQLREQIKQTSKISNKRNKSNNKLKKKIDINEKTIKELEYKVSEQNKKLIRYSEKINEFELSENKYNNAILSYKTLQNEIEEYIFENTELKNKICNLENEILINKQHSNELRKQSNRDRKNISRLTNCNHELNNIIQQCENILIESAHKYLPISVINDQELELTDSDDDNYINIPALISSNCNKKNNIIYFNDSDSDEKNDEQKNDEEDDIFKVAKQKDIKTLQMATRLKIQIAMLSEQLEKFNESIINFKHELHRKEEETLKQQYELRQIAMRKRLEEQVKKELVKRERNMVSIASVRGVNMRHKMSLANLTKTQDEINKIVNDIQENDQLWKNNISMQLSGNTKSNSMDLLLLNNTNNDSVINTPSSESLKSNNRNRRKRFLSDADVLETQSMHSLSSGHSKRSINSHSAMSLKIHDRNRKYGKHKMRYKNKQRRAMKPMQTITQKESGNNNKEKVNRKTLFGSKWFG